MDSLRRKLLNNKKKVAVVVPHVEFPLTSDQHTSLCHLRKHLGIYDRYFIGTKTLPANLSDFRFKRFPASSFLSIESYSRLLLSKRFYHSFRDYEYILIYQLDSLVFCDALKQWCEEGWDYVGAPWFEEYGAGLVKKLWRVGNGGFSLRKVSSCVRVLESKVPLGDPSVMGGRMREFNAGPMTRKLITIIKTMLHRIGYKNNVNYFIKDFLVVDDGHEDKFWSLDACKFVSNFRIPPPEHALRFAFECFPRECFRLNNMQIPFGCHAWAKYDRAFWQKYVLDD